MKKLIIALTIIAVFATMAYAQTTIDGRQIRDNSIPASKIIGDIGVVNS